MVNALKAAGSTTVRYDAMQNYEHNIWGAVYSLPTLYTWLFSKVKAEPVVDTEPLDTEPQVTDTQPNNTDVQTEAAEERSGCLGTVGIGAVAVVATAGAAVAVKLKKED